MKTLKFTIIGIFVLYFQLIAAPHFSWFSIIPMFLIAYFVYVSIHMQAKYLFPLAFLFGLAMDIMYPPLLGINTISFLIISFVVHKFHMNVNKQRFIIVSISIFFINLIHYSILILYYLLASQLIENFWRLYLFSIIYNSVVSIIVVYILVVSEKIKITLNV